jgi:hypothetical protein
MLQAGRATRKLLWHPSMIVSREDLCLDVCVSRARKRSRKLMLNESILQSIMVVAGKQPWTSDDSLFTTFGVPHHFNAYATLL